MKNNKTIIYYDETKIEEEHDIIDRDARLKNSKLWIDISDPSESELMDLQVRFDLDKNAIEKVKQKTKKSMVTESDISDKKNINKKFDTIHKFSILLDLKLINIDKLQGSPIYFFVGDRWLITLHSAEIDLVTKVKIIFSEKKSILTSLTIDPLYYSILSYLILTYEHLLTAIELKVFEIEKDAQYRPSMQVLKHLDSLSRQVILLRRHFWDARNVISYHTYMEKDNDDIRYLQIVQDSINQLIEMIQSYQDTINSTRGLFSDSISLQMNETMRILTIFSVIALPLSIIIGVLSIQGFDLNNLESIPKYFGVVTLMMVSVTLILLFIFWKKRWIFSSNNKTF